MVSSTTNELTPEQAAKYLGKSYRFVIQIIEAGELEALNLKSPKSRLPRYRIPLTALLAWKAGRTVRPLAEQERRVRSMPRMVGVLAARRAARLAQSQNEAAQPQTA